MSGDQLSACQAGEGIGKRIVFVVILQLWALVDVILGVIYLVTRRNNRTDPPGPAWSGPTRAMSSVRLAGWGRHRHHRDQPQLDRVGRHPPGRRLDRTGGRQERDGR